MPKIKLHHLIFMAVIGITAFLLRPSLHLIETAIHDHETIEPLAPGFSDDASRLNKTKVAEIWQKPSKTNDLIKPLKKLLEKARKNNLKVAIAGAQHSMGGHTITPEGIIIDTCTWKQMSLNKEKKVLTVQSGALWSDVIAFLDTHGFSIEVMQSNNSFSIGGSISVNCHGWQYDRPPIADTVQSFNLMKADGSVVHCSRNQNQELFSLVLGGYGLFGIIMEINLRVIPNQRYLLQQKVVPTHKALASFDTMLVGQNIPVMVYARMNIDPHNFLKDIIINAYYPDTEGKIPPLSQPALGKLKRTVFRGSANSNYGKRLRWNAETQWQPLINPLAYSRNQLLNESVDILRNRTSDTTDILHEYFIPKEKFTSFIKAMQTHIPAHQADLINVTLRSVNEDKDTFLRYADKPMFAFVLLFVQKRDKTSENNMRALTQKLIDAALQHDGCYYLPYRLHASQKQFDKAYPQGQEFFDLKRHYDPQEIFNNAFYLKYSKSQNNLL